MDLSTYIMFFIGAQVTLRAIQTAGGVNKEIASDNHPTLQISKFSWMCITQCRREYGQLY